MGTDTAPVQRKMTEMFRHDIQVVRKRPGLGVEIHEHETLPDLALYRLEIVMLGADMRKVPTAWYIQQVSVQLPDQPWKGQVN